MHCNYAAIELMSLLKGGQGGVIINISSVAGLDVVPRTDIHSYTASKYAVTALTRSFGV